ncbi:hypothetical protein FRAHR75_700004 [Frankia sp. Hr75.2]|nr:hypothetical protein FRAHR75_700004 [Frankia sp. Hr75.2]
MLYVCIASWQGLVKTGCPELRPCASDFDHSAAVYRGRLAAPVFPVDMSACEGGDQVRCAPPGHPAILADRHDEHLDVYCAFAWSVLGGRRSWVRRGP